MAWVRRGSGGRRRKHLISLSPRKSQLSAPLLIACTCLILCCLYPIFRVSFLPLVLHFILPTPPHPFSPSSFTHSPRLCPQNYPDSSLRRSAWNHQITMESEKKKKHIERRHSGRCPLFIPSPCHYFWVAQMCTYISHSSVLDDRSPCCPSLSRSVCCPSLRWSVNGVICFSNVIASFSFGKMSLYSGFILSSPHLTLGWYTQIPLPRCLSSKKATSLSSFLLVSSIFAVPFSNTAPLFHHLLGEKSHCLFNQDHIPTWRTCPNGVCSWHQPCGSCVLPFSSVQWWQNSRGTEELATANPGLCQWSLLANPFLLHSK